MPEVWPEAIEWDDGNAVHATAHGVRVEEIEQVIANGPTYRRNKRGRAGDLLAIGGDRSYGPTRGVPDDGDDNVTTAIGVTPGRTDEER